MVLSKQDRIKLFDVMNHVIIRRTILMEKYFIRVSAAIIDNIQNVNLYKALNSIWGSSVSLSPISTFDSTPTHPKSDDVVDLPPPTLPPPTLLQSSTQVAFPQSPQQVTQLQTPIQPSSSDRDSNTGSVGDEERSVGTDTDDDMFSIDDCPCKSPLVADDSDADVRPLNTHCIIVDWDDTLMATTSSRFSQYCNDLETCTLLPIQNKDGFRCRVNNTCLQYGITSVTYPLFQQGRLMNLHTPKTFTCGS